METAKKLTKRTFRPKRTLKQKALSIGLAALGAIAVVSAAGCGPEHRPAINGKSYTAADIDARVVDAYNAFGFDLHRAIAGGHRATGENVFLSPTSVALALSMTMNGAVGPTRDGMAQALRLQELTTDEANDGALKLQEVLQATDPAVQLSIANSIWARQGVSFQKSFLDANKAYYGAEAQTLDFTNRKAAATINKWVKKETSGRIESIVDETISAQSIMFLLNAVYFKGDWSVPFERNATRDRPFALTDGTKTSRAMMARTGAFEFADRDGYAAARLPYGNGNTGMVVLLPDEGTTLSSLADRFTEKEWRDVTAALSKQQGEVILPRFEMEYEISLNEQLKALGMSLAFNSDQADFSELLAPPPTAYIGDVKHKTFVRVEEKGTEAAAVTKVEAMTTSAPSASGFRMEMNRPFLIVLHESSTGAVLFIGSVYDPQL